MKLVDKLDARIHANERNDPEIYPWIRSENKTTEQEQQEWFDKQEYFWSVEHDGALIGVVGFTDVTTYDAEFSCMIYSQYRGKGYGYKALELLFDYGFYAMNLKNIYGHTYGYINNVPTQHKLTVDVPYFGKLYINPAMKLFQQFKMTISGPCLYPELSKEKKNALVWRLDLPVYVYHSLLA